MSKHGYSGANYDKWVERTETSTIHKMKETFWTTKQAVMQKLGKKEDEHVVASDHELDTKLEVFRAIQKQSMDLLRCIEKYQDRLCAVSQDENATGRFLKSQSNIDKTRAGKMMAAVGKSQSFAAQQRLALRVPLVRLYQEVETFRYRAISDTLMTINRMEGARTEYRGALLWMKNISEELDPDTYKQLEKFRKVQAQVRKTKAKFDKLKLDVMQKVDLLAASRCNMFSHVLANYQSTLLHFWEKTSRTMSAVAESFKGYQYYEFNIIKELSEPSKKLAEDTSKSEPAERDNEEFDPSKQDKLREKDSKTESPESSEIGSVSTATEERDESFCSKCGQRLPPLLNLDSPSQCDREFFNDSPRLIAFDEEDDQEGNIQKNGSLQNLFPGDKEDEKSETTKTTSKTDEEGLPSFIEFDEDVQDFDFSGKSLPSSDKPKANKNLGPTDLLSSELNLEADDSEKDDMTILNEILNAPSTGEDDFTKEWQAVFGNTPLSAGTNFTPVESDQEQSAGFMPSNLLDLTRQKTDVDQGLTGVMGLSDVLPPGAKPTAQPTTKQSKPKTGNKKAQKDMSAWFSLFADLDPLSNPDAIGKTPDDMTDA